MSQPPWLKLKTDRNKKSLRGKGSWQVALLKVILSFFARLTWMICLSNVGPSQNLFKVSEWIFGSLRASILILILFPNISHGSGEFQMWMLIKQSRVVATHPDGKYEGMISCCWCHLSPAIWPVLWGRAAKTQGLVTTKNWEKLSWTYRHFSDLQLIFIVWDHPHNTNNVKQKKRKEKKIWF